MKNPFNIRAPAFNAQAINATIARALASAGLDPTSGTLLRVTETIKRALAPRSSADMAPGPAVDATVIDVEARVVAREVDAPQDTHSDAKPVPTDGTKQAPGSFQTHAFSNHAGTRSLQHVFMELLRATAVAHRGPDWDEANFGPGILNVRDLLAAPLPAPGSPETISVRRDRTYAELLDRLGAPVPIGLEAVGGVEPYGAELIDLLYRSGPRRDRS